MEENDKIYSAINLIDGTERSWAADRNDKLPTIEILLREEIPLGSQLDHLYIKNVSTTKRYA